MLQLLLLLDFREVKEMYSLPQLIDKLGGLFVALLCERLAYVIIHLPHHVAKVTCIDMPCQHFTQLRDVPGTMATTSVGCISKGCGISKEEICLLRDDMTIR